MVLDARVPAAAESDRDWGGAAHQRDEADTAQEAVAVEKTQPGKRPKEQKQRTPTTVDVTCFR